MEKKKITGEEIIKAFRDLSIYEAMLGNSHKAGVYTFTADMLEFVDDIPGALASGEIGSIKGIGPATVAKINELVKSGTMNKLENYKTKVPETVLELTKIKNVGPKTAYKLYSAHGVETLDELAKIKVAALPFNDKTINSIKTFNYEK